MTTSALMSAASEVTATEKELAGRIQLFEAEVYRGDAARLAIATEAAHAALQGHLDAKAGMWAVAQRDFKP
jgi:hypothetical protein